MKKKILKPIHRYQLLTQNKQQAISVIGLIFKDHSNKSINAQINNWIDLHPRREEINQFLDVFAELEETYTLSDFMAPVCEICGWENNPVVREATALAISMVLIDCSWNLFGKKLFEKKSSLWELDILSEDYKTIAQIFKEVDISLLIEALFMARESVTGKRYFKHFLSLIERTNLSTKNKAGLLNKERIENQQGQIIILSGCLRGFLDACFFLFKESFGVEMQQNHSEVAGYN